MNRFFDFKNPMISTTPEGAEYLRRYFIVETDWFRIYLHKISLSDADPCMHDHPWRFISIILRGGYREHTPHGTFDRKPGRILYHGIPWLHRLELSKPAWTIVIGGAVKRVWGFMTPTGWEPFEEYIRKRQAEAQAASAETRAQVDAAPWVEGTDQRERPASPG
jgi:hypothetical protein